MNIGTHEPIVLPHVSKNDTDLALYNSDVHQPILISFSRSVAKRVNYEIINFSTSALPGKHKPQKLRVFT